MTKLCYSWSLKYLKSSLLIFDVNYWNPVFFFTQSPNLELCSWLFFLNIYLKRNTYIFDKNMKRAYIFVSSPRRIYQLKLVFICACFYSLRKVWCSSFNLLTKYYLVCSYLFTWCNVLMMEPYVKVETSGLHMGHSFFNESNIFFSTFQDMYSRTVRRTVMRYVNLSTVLVFRLVSTKVRDRFPTYASLVEAGLMLPGEDIRLAEIDSK